MTVQNKTWRSNYIKANITQKSKYRLCGDRDETVNHQISESRKQAQKEYKCMHDWEEKVIHWELRKRLKFSRFEG